MTDQEVARLLHPKENSYFLLALVAIAPFAFLIALLILFTFGLLLIYIGFIVLAIWMAAKLFRARLLSQCARVTADNFPRIHAMTEEIKKQLGYDKPVEVYIVQEGLFNSFLVSLFNIKVVLLTSEILCEGVSDQEIKFIIARFIGGLRAKSYRYTLLPELIATTENFVFLNLLLYPYERAVVLSGDRIGLAAIGGDVASAIMAMNRLCVGVHCGVKLNVRAMLLQREDLEDFFGFILNIFSNHPSMPRRYDELLTFAQLTYPEAHRRLSLDATHLALETRLQPTRGYAT